MYLDWEKIGINEMISFEHRVLSEFKLKIAKVDTLAKSIMSHENLVQVPSPVRVRSHPACPIATDFGCKHRAKSIPPEPNCFVTDVDATLMQKIFDIPQ